MLISDKAKELINPNLVLLETAWDGRGIGCYPDWFVINPKNNSGRRLYKLMGDKPFVVGNSAPEVVMTANHHGVPSPLHVITIIEEAEKLWDVEVIVVGGLVAEKTFLMSEFKPKARVVFIPHPAARFWTKEMVSEAQNAILGTTHNARLYYVDKKPKWIQY